MFIADKLGEGVPVSQTSRPLQAKVISEFSSGLYVKDEQDRIFAIGGPKIPAGPIHMVLRRSPPKKILGSEMRIYADLL